MNFHVYKDKNGEWRWTLRASNGRIIADSAEGYTRRRAALNAVILMRSLQVHHAKVTVHA